MSKDCHVAEHKWPCRLSRGNGPSIGPSGYQGGLRVRPVGPGVGVWLDPRDATRRARRSSHAWTGRNGARDSGAGQINPSKTGGARGCATTRVGRRLVRDGRQKARWTSEGGMAVGREVTGSRERPVRGGRPFSPRLQPTCFPSLSLYFLFFLIFKKKTTRVIYNVVTVIRRNLKLE